MKRFIPYMFEHVCSMHYVMEMSATLYIEKKKKTSTHKKRTAKEVNAPQSYKCVRDNAIFNRQ